MRKLKNQRSSVAMTIAGEKRGGSGGENRRKAAKPVGSENKMSPAWHLAIGEKRRRRHINSVWRQNIWRWRGVATAAAERHQRNGGENISGYRRRRRLWRGGVAAASAANSGINGVSAA